MSTTSFGPVGTDTDILVPYPDPPPRHPDEMSSFRQLTNTGGAHYMGMHFRDPTTLIVGELYLVPEPGRGTKGLHVPDMMVAFDVDPEACYRRNAYVISEQGKPPDFVLEVASESTGRVDVEDKPAAYAALGIPEYWRFDETGASHGTRLAGDRLVVVTSRSRSRCCRTAAWRAIARHWSCVCAGRKDSSSGTTPRRERPS